MMVNTGLRGLGMTPLPSAVATADINAPAGYSPIGAAEGQRNDVAIAMNGLRKGELGGHAMVLTGPLQMHNGRMMYPTIGTNTMGPNGIIPIGGERWRSPDELTIQRDQATKSAALDHKLAIDISHDKGINTAISGSGNGRTTVRSVRTFSSDVG